MKKQKNQYWVFLPLMCGSKIMKIEMITKCKVREFKMFYELLEITLIDFLHMSSLNSCGMAQ
jgi:intergrase/recombinase